MGLEPQWVINIILPSKPEKDKRIDATTSWIPHYREATIIIKQDLVTNLDRFTKTLIPELIHVRMADVHDWILEQTPSGRREDAVNILEQTVSEVSNLYTNEFLKVYADELAQFETPTK